MSSERSPSSASAGLHCSPAVKQLLDAGLDLFVGVNAESLYSTGPEFIRIRLNTAFIVDAHQKIEACISCGFDEARLQKSPAFWDTECQIQVSQWYMYVDKSETWFEGRGNQGSQCKSSPLSLPYLIQSLESAVAGTLDDEHVDYYGNALFYTDYDMDRLFDLVQERFPELDAAETANKMGQIIEAAAPVDRVSHPTPASQSRRAAI